MLSLGYELIAILGLVAIIGIVMGRFFCKSGESEEKEKKKKVIYAYESAQKELEFQKNRVEEHASELQVKEDYIAQCEQNIHNLNTKLESSNKERKKLLEELKILEKYKLKFESLEKEFTLQSKRVEDLKNEKINNQKEISDFKILRNELSKNITNSQKNREELEEEVTSLNARLKDEKEAYEELDNKYKKFIQTHNLDNDRLSTLEVENKKIYHLLKSIEMEREDLLNRLRAISSVVGAVGIEHVKEESQVLLENK